MQAKESKKSKPQKYEEHERKVEAAILYKKDHPAASWRWLSREFGPSASTLRRRFLKLTKPRRQAHSSQQRLPSPLENAVVARIKELDASGRPPTRKRVQAIANVVLREKYGPNATPVGRQWAHRLYKRRPKELARRVRRQLQRKRLAVQYREDVEDHFRRLGKTIRKHQIEVDDIWNSD